MKDDITPAGHRDPEEDPSSRAWSGVEALVLASSEAERGELGALLASEKVSVFSSYSEAYDYAKKKGTVAFAAVSDMAREDSHPLPLEHAVSQLLRPFESKGWPGFGLLLRSGDHPTMDAARAAAHSPRILDYIPLSEASPALFWSISAAAFERWLIPESLRNTLVALSGIRPDSWSFLERVTLMLGGPETGSGLTWFELTGAVWLPVVDRLKSAAPSAAAANPVLAQLADLAASADAPVTPEAVLDMDAAPPAKVAALAAALELARSEGRLEERLASLEKRGGERGAQPVERQGAGDRLRRRLFYSRRGILDLAAEAAAGAGPEEEC